MSVLVDIPGTVPAPESVRLTTIGTTDIYTATDANSIVVAIIVANETAGAVTILVDRFDGSTNFHTFAKSVAANGSEILSDFPIRLLTGHKIKATAGSANALTVSIVRGVIPGRNIAGGPA